MNTQWRDLDPIFQCQLRKYVADQDRKCFDVYAKALGFNPGWIELLYLTLQSEREASQNTSRTIDLCGGQNTENQVFQETNSEMDQSNDDVRVIKVVTNKQETTPSDYAHNRHHHNSVYSALNNGSMIGFNGNQLRFVDVSRIEQPLLISSNAGRSLNSGLSGATMRLQNLDIDRHESAIRKLINQSNQQQQSQHPNTGVPHQSRMNRTSVTSPELQRGRTQTMSHSARSTSPQSQQPLIHSVTIRNLPDSNERDKVPVTVRGVMRAGSRPSLARRYQDELARWREKHCRQRQQSEQYEVLKNLPRKKRRKKGDYPIVPEAVVQRNKMKIKKLAASCNAYKRSLGKRKNMTPIVPAPLKQTRADIMDIVDRQHKRRRTL